MSNTENLLNKEAIDKLKKLAEEINICLFCTNLKTDDGSTCRPMSVQEVDEEGNLWFFSDVYSIKNREIKQDKNVQLFFAHPGKSSYLVVNGEAEIIFDKNKVEELWTPIVKAWFKEGKDDPNISILKINSKSAYYWDTDGSKMINFIKMLTAAVTGSETNIGKEGEIQL
jgi:general stress protein 26